MMYIDIVNINMENNQSFYISIVSKSFQLEQKLSAKRVKMEEISNRKED